MNTTPSEPFNADQPSWATPSTPAGSGSESAATGPSGRPGQPGARLFDGIRSLGLVRPDHGR